MKKIHLTVLIGVLAVCFVSCSDQQVENQKTTTSSNIEKEFELLSSETELNALLTRGNEGIVDWELSREIAQMQCFGD